MEKRKQCQTPPMYRRRFSPLVWFQICFTEPQSKAQSFSFGDGGRNLKGRDMRIKVIPRKGLHTPAGAELKGSRTSRQRTRSPSVHREHGASVWFVTQPAAVNLLGAQICLVSLHLINRGYL